MHRLTASVALLLIVTAGRRALAGEEREDPTAWTPPAKRPAFREVLVGEDYERRFRAALGKIDRAEFERSKEPVAAVKFASVVPGGPAEVLGVKAGDFALGLDGTPVAFKWQFNPMRSDRPQTLLVQRRDGRKEELTIRPGRIGVGMQTHWRPELEYVRGKERLARCDDEILVALTSVWDDAELAETALFHAVAKGYRPRGATDTASAEIAMAQGRFDDALAFSWLAVRADPRNVHAANTLTEMAMSRFKLELGHRMLREYPYLVLNGPRRGERLIAEYRLHAEAEGHPPSPFELAAGRQRLNMLADPKPLNSLSGFYLGYAARGGLDLLPPAGKSIPVVFGPEVSEAEITMTFTAEPKVEPPKDSFFLVGWLDADHDYFENAKKCEHMHGGFSLKVTSTGALTVTHPIAAFGTNHNRTDVHVDGLEENSFTMVVCGGQVEAAFNGRSVCRAPWPPSVKRLVPCMKAISMNVRISQLSFSELGGPVPETEEVEDEDVF